MARNTDPNRDRVFMSHNGSRIWYGRTGDGDIFYMVAKGDGTDQYFVDWRDAMDWIDERKERRTKK